MPWGKLDDKFHRNAKVRALRRLKGPGREALGCWVFWWSWCLDDGELTGFVPAVELSAPDLKCAALLVEVGLWDEAPDGYQFHDFGDYNPKAAQVAAKKEADRLRVAAKREAEKLAKLGDVAQESQSEDATVAGASQATSHATSHATSARVASTRVPSPPVPSRPDPIPTGRSESDPPAESSPDPEATLLARVCSTYERVLHRGNPTITAWERTAFFFPLLPALIARRPDDVDAQGALFEATLRRWCADLRRRGQRPKPEWLKRDFAQWVDDESGAGSPSPAATTPPQLPPPFDPKTLGGDA